MKNLKVNTIYVDTKSKVLNYGGLSFSCVIGKEGVTSHKKEGDLKTPLGIFQVREVFYRKDRLGNGIDTKLPLLEIHQDFGWCDDPQSSLYNKFIENRSLFTCSHERLWRQDRLYNIVVVLGYNDAPAVPGNGSAIFLHAARPTMTPTHGCIALAQDDLIRLLKELPRNCYIDIS